MQYTKANTEQDSESQENLLSEEESHVQRPEKTTKKWRQGFLMLLYMVGTALACLAAGLVGYNWERDMNGVCIRHISEPSPLQSRVTFHEQDFNGSFLKETAFRKDPSPETDAVWSSIGTDYRPMRISSEDARMAGIPHDYVKIDEKYGGGHPVSIEGFHHLHCLNLLRQALYYNYEHYRDLGQGAFMNEEFIVKRHVTHCLDILRQQLMCFVDVGVFGQVWIYPDNPEPFVDFNTQHRCRNFEQLRQFAEQNQLPEDVPPDFLQRPREGDRIYSGVP